MNGFGYGGRNGWKTEQTDGSKLLFSDPQMVFAVV